MIHEYRRLRDHVLNGHLGAEDANIPKVLVAEIELLHELVYDLMMQARNSPCLVSYPDEITYNCNPERVCRVCAWRDGVDTMLHDEWSMPDGLWSTRGEVEMIQKREEK